MSAAQWRKSSYSNGDRGECIEVADGFPAMVPVRGSKVPHRPVLLFSADFWKIFIAEVKVEPRVL